MVKFKIITFLLQSMKLINLATERLVTFKSDDKLRSWNATNIYILIIKDL